MANPSSVILPPFKLLNAETSSGVSALLPVSPLFNCCGHVEATDYVEWSHTSAAGTVVVETAARPDYAGTWANLGTANWSAIDTVSSISVSGIYGAVRVRISSAVTTGTVDVWAITANA